MGLLQMCKLLMGCHALQADQAGLRASMARPKQVPRMLASISEDRPTGALQIRTHGRHWLLFARAHLEH